MIKENTTYRMLLLSFIALMVSCSGSDDIDVKGCVITKEVEAKRDLNPNTKFIYNSIIENTVSFKNDQGDQKQFKVTKDEDIVFWSVTFYNPEDDCDYKYITNRDKYEINYNNVNESQSMNIGFLVSGYYLKEDNVDSLVALYDYLSFGGGNTLIAAGFVIDKREDIIMDDDYFFDYLVTDTTLNCTTYDSIFVLPNALKDNDILYSIPYGIIQFENDGVIWDFCL